MSATAAGPEHAPRELVNLRDLGDLPTDDGRRTRSRVLWRSDAPLAGDTTVGPDGPVAGSWPPPTTVDLREPTELRAPHPLVADGTALTSLPLLGDLAPGTFEAGRRGELSLGELYLQLLDSAPRWLPELFAVAVSAPAPVLVHCAAGKDRTGIAVAVLLRAAGVTRAAVASDFADTNRRHRDLRDRLVVQGALSPRISADAVGVTPAHLEPVLDRLEPDPWTLPTAAGVDEATLAAWRDRLLGAA